MFISIEGCDGSGKTTIAEYVVSLLSEKGHSVVHTREPGGTPAAEEIRSLIIKPRDEHMPPKAEALLLYAARMIHVENLINLSMKKGQWVVSERFHDSTFAYQVARGACSMEEMEDLNKWALNGFKPTLTILLDVSLDVGKERTGKRGNLDRLELEYDSFMGKSKEIYTALSKKEPHRFKIVNADLPIEEVKKEVEEIIKRFTK